MYIKHSVPFSVLFALYVEQDV